MVVNWVVYIIVPFFNEELEQTRTKMWDVKIKWSGLETFLKDKSSITHIHHIGDIHYEFEIQKL